MTETFTASNGMRVWDRDGTVLVQGVFPDALTIPPLDVDALREFFQHEKDEQLGRWRWPANPDYVVYPVGDGVVDVLRETSVSEVTLGPGRQAGITRDDAAGWDRDHSKNFYRAAREYFEAHPEPKPWHDAKPGEVWVLNIDHKNAANEVAWQVATSTEFSRLGLAINKRDERITAARRIWPTEVSNG